MRLKQVGKNTLAAEVTSISPFGVWIYLKDHEYFLDYDEFPWFEDSKVKEVMNVKLLNDNHLYWPDLDVDLLSNQSRTPKRFHASARETNQEDCL
jgi:hypothetical protein